MSSDMIPGYLDRQTGEVELITEADRAAADSEDSELKDWELERAAIVRLIDEEPIRFVRLPERFEINDYRMMEDFIETVTDPVMSARLDESIRGSGAFRRFKDATSRLGLSKQWFEFRDKKYLEVAREWCKDENIEAE